MDINITFVIQMFNFGVSYYFLKHVFLKPALHILDEREEQFNRLTLALKQDELGLQNKIVYKNGLIQDFKQHIKVQEPMLEEPVMQELYKPITYRYSNNAVINYRQAFKECLVKKVDHAR